MFDITTEAKGRPGKSAWDLGPTVAAMQRDIGGDVVQEYEQAMPREVLFQINGQTSQNFRGDKSNRVRRSWALGSAFLINAKGEALDIVPIVKAIYIACKKASPVGVYPSGRKGGFYRSQFKFSQDGTFVRRPTQGGTYYSVINTADYAATLEKKGWPRTMFKIYQRFSRKFNGRLDIRFAYLGNLDANTSSGGRRFQAMPRIDVAPLGAMKGRTGIQIKRRGGWRNRYERRKRKK